MKVDNSKDWKNKNLSQIAELIRDIFLPDNKYNFPYLGLEHINQQTLTINSIGNSSEIISQKYVFKKGDILFGKLRPYFRKVFKPNFDGICSTDIFVLRAKKDIIQKYLFYIIANSDFIEFASLGSIGTKMPRADWNHVKNYRCQIPDIHTQKKISEILSSLDKKIELNNKINNSLEQISKTIFKHWFIDFEFPNKQGKPYKSSGGNFIYSELGKIPEGWKIYKLLDCGEIICGKTPPKSNKNYFGGDIPFIKIPDMHDNIFILKTEDSLTEQGKKFQENKTIPSNSIIVSCIATVGLVSITSSESQTNQQINSLIPSCKSSLYYLYFKLKNLKNYFKTIGSSGSTTLNINTTIFSNIKVIMPTNNILEKFNKIVSPIFNSILLNSREKITLSQIRDTLLPKLITGKIRVNLDDKKES